MFLKTKPTTHTRYFLRKSRNVPLFLSPRLMRDIGLESWPEEPKVPTCPRAGKHGSFTERK